MLEVNFSPFPELKTERLFLREVSKSDVQEIFYLRSNPVVMQYIDRERAKSSEDALKFIDLIHNNRINNDGIQWAITMGDPDKLLGLISLWRLDKPNYRAEIGYVLHDAVHRQGIMNEALKAVVQYAFAEMKLHSIEANVNPANAASAALLEKNGFVREGYFREDYFFNGKFLDSAIYSLLARDAHFITT
jgi:[ribosomal protein S5]-alanine N-acetyltransferase